jgi:hypothetical protein
VTDPFTERQNRGTHKHGQKSERKTAKRLGGRTRPGSGAVAGAKGDILLTDYLVENKSTEHQSISLKLSWLEKISVEAREEGKAPALSIQFVDKQGNSKKRGRWVLMTEDDFTEATQ